MKKSKYEMYSNFEPSQFYDMTSDFGKKSEYDMYSDQESKCGEHHIHVGPLVIEFCQHEDGKQHVCVYVEESGEMIAETEISDHGMEDHFQSIADGMGDIHRAYQASGSIKKAEKPFHGYNPKKHSRTGGLSDSYRKKINREEGSNLKRPVTGKVKPGSKAAKRRKSFCARMSGVSGPTSKEGKLTPKGAALKRWKCHKSEEMAKGAQGDWQKEGYTIHHSDLNPNDHEGWKMLFEAVKNGHGGLPIKKEYNPQEDKWESYDWLTDPEQVSKAYEEIKNGTSAHDGGVKFPFIYAKDSNGNYAGSIGHSGHEIVANNVLDNHRRKGLSTAMHNHSEKMNNIKAESTTLTDQGEDFWNQPNRPFGKSEQLKNFMAKVDQKRQLEHYSKTPGLKNIDPKYIGTGVPARGQETKQTAHPHSFYYKPEAPTEELVTRGATHKYMVDLPEDAKIYDISTDPEGFAKQVREENNGAFNMDMMHEKMKNSGYHGFEMSQHPVESMRGVVGLYHSMPVSESIELWRK